MSTLRKWGPLIGVAALIVPLGVFAVREVRKQDVEDAKDRRTDDEIEGMVRDIKQRSAARREQERLDAELASNARYWCAVDDGGCFPSKEACEEYRDRLPVATSSCAPSRTAWCFDNSDASFNCLVTAVRCNELRTAIMEVIERRTRYPSLDRRDPPEPAPITACRERS